MAGNGEGGIKKSPRKSLVVGVKQQKRPGLEHMREFSPDTPCGGGQWMRDAVKCGDASAGATPSPSEVIAGPLQDSEECVRGGCLHIGRESLYLATTLTQELQDSIVVLTAAGRPLKVAAVFCEGRAGGSSIEDYPCYHGDLLESKKRPKMTI